MKKLFCSPKTKIIVMTSPKTVYPGLVCRVLCMHCAAPQ